MRTNNTGSGNTGVDDALASEARISGRRAGRNHLSPSANPHLPGTSVHREWELGRQSVADENAAANDQRLALKAICQYREGMACDCGGRGHCLDVA